MDIKYLYRISSQGNHKQKIALATKMYCLDNFIREFKTNIYVFADNCTDDLISEIRSRQIEIFLTTLGNSKSWRYVVEYALANFVDECYIYLVEDDYLHLPGSLIALKEGLIIADYVSLYDHPDKYIDFKDGGPNPYIKNGGEMSQVFLTKNFHWKQTNSTTMTFATSVKKLRKDKIIWWYFTKSANPLDFFAFQILTRQKFILLGRSYRELIKLLFLKRRVKDRRLVISCIPGLATHCEVTWLTPLTNWHSFNSWATFDQISNR